DQAAADKAAADKAAADATADATQASDTAKANSDATANQNTQNTKYDAQVKDQTVANTASEVSAQKDVVHAQYNIDHPTATAATPADSTTNAAAAYYDEGHTINSTANLPTSIQDPKIPSSAVNNQYYADFYGGTGDNDTTEAINGSATDAQQKELADYAITLINSFRQTHKLAPVTWSKNVEDATIASARAREAAGSEFTHTGYLKGSANTESEKAYASKGLTFSLENIGMTSYSDLTMLTAKAAILNAMTAMIYQDGYSQNGHLETFLTPDLTMGFAIQKFNGGYILLFQGAYPASNYDANDANNKNQELTSTTLIEAQRGGDTYANRQALDNAKATLQSVQKENAQKLTDLANANADAKAAIQNQLENTISIINATHDAAIQANAKTYADTVANIEANAQKQHDDNASKLSTTPQTPTTSKPNTGNDTEPSTVVPDNPKDGDQFNAVDPVTTYSYGILTYQASTGYWLDTSGNDIDPYNPQHIRHTAAQIAATKAADDKAHEIVPGTDITRPDDDDTNIGGSSEVINGQTSVSSTATDKAAADKAAQSNISSDFVAANEG
ncbi:SEC10/PgrA surface exclusion domain-containing protein, partial [Leuconostoc mesenteroides]|uniref:SEC10/PgrA surface exclusion domain-containing protein n=1 Tax=Leuconostoc mesenteroides TaxID=1245 RepID=UPI00236164E3